VIGAFATHVTLRQAIEFRVHEWRKSGQRFLFAIAPRFEELGQFVRVGYVHYCL